MRLKHLATFTLFTTLILSVFELSAKDDSSKAKKGSLKLKTLKIQGNRELPKVLFIVPWQEVNKQKGHKNEQQLVLHSLYGDLFDPIVSLDLNTTSNPKQ